MRVKVTGRLLCYEALSYQALCQKCRRHFTRMRCYVARAKHQSIGTNDMRQKQAILPTAPQVRTRSPAAPHLRILRAATRAFADRGLTGARVADIAARAKVNKRMLYHYYGNKEALYLAVLENVYGELLAAESALKLDALDPIEGIERLVRFLWEYYVAHPEFMTLVNNENLHRARHLKRSRTIRAMHSPLIESLDALLARGRRQGVFRGGVDAIQLYITIAAVGYFYLSNNATLSTIFGRKLKSRRALLERAHHIAEVVLGYLARP